MNAFGGLFPRLEQTLASIMLSKTRNVVLVLPEQYSLRTTKVHGHMLKTGSGTVSVVSALRKLHHSASCSTVTCC